MLLTKKNLINAHSVVINVHPIVKEIKLAEMMDPRPDNNMRNNVQTDSDIVAG